MTWKAMPTFLPYWKAISWTSGSEFTRMETFLKRKTNPQDKKESIHY